MPKIDPASAPFDEPCRGRSGVRLGVAGGLTHFGVNLVTLEPGAWASQRHWHQCEDEFIYVLEGELVLVEDAGETLLRPGDSAAWPAGIPDGHHVQNRTELEARYLVVGTRDDADYGEYPDIDMVFAPGRYSGTPKRFRRKDGTPY